MRAGLSTIQQTLTPDAASVLNHSISEAGRRNHGQTTPLHVAATLLASPSGFLRQACIRSHPNSSHPLQCRALELCFSVALERLPTCQSSSPAAEPPISNALMAALKRAQAHQRRGCPEQQQQPLLAVKVELEQLIISILDDPSVSRVMREASFSSPAVKATIEQSLNSTSATGPGNPPHLGIGFRPSSVPILMLQPNRNLCLNPRLQQGNPSQSTEALAKHPYINPRLQPVNSAQSGEASENRNPYLNPRLQQPSQLGQQRDDDVKRVIDILSRTKKRNPILVGESEPEVVVKEVFRALTNGAPSMESSMRNLQVVSIEKELGSEKTQISTKIKELRGVIERKIATSNVGGVVLDLGDLKWLVEQQPVAGSTQQTRQESGKEAVGAMGKLLERFREEGGICKIWFVGTATCETYLRCQVYHPSMEADWDLQAVPIASRAPVPGMFPRMGTDGILGSSVQPATPLKSLTALNIMPRSLTTQISDPARKSPYCPQCSGDYERELAELGQGFEKSSYEPKSESSQHSFPQWLQNAKIQSGEVQSQQTKDKELLLKQRTQELQKKWIDNCLHIHANYHQRLGIPSKPSLSNLLLSQHIKPKTQPPRILEESLQLKLNQGTTTPAESMSTPPRSPVGTDLVLGPKKVAKTNPSDDSPGKDLLGCISSEPQTQFPFFQKGKFGSSTDADSFKKLLKGLMRKAWWQPEAASALATTIMQCQLGDKNNTKGATWLLFAGPDGAGKKKMATVLAAHICGSNPVSVCLGTRRDEEELDLSFRGKTALDRIAEAVRRNPFSVIMLIDFDEADLLVQGSIKRAMERGKLSDSHGREISLGNIVFVLTGNWSTANKNEYLMEETRLESLSSRNWLLRLNFGESRPKRRGNWLLDRQTRPRKENGISLSLDLNLSADIDEEKTDNSLNVSDLTVDHEDVHFSVPHELVSSSHGTVVFKPVQFGLVLQEIERMIEKAFSNVLEVEVPIEAEEEALKMILSGLWFGRAGLEEWAEAVLVPSFRRLKGNLARHSPEFFDKNLAVRLEADGGFEPANGLGWLPSEISVVVDGKILGGSGAGHDQIPWRSTMNDVMSR